MSDLTIGFLTAKFLGGLYDDDRLAAEALGRRGATVVPVDWLEPISAGLDALVIRTPWDWFHHRARFRDFLASLSSFPAPVFNDVPTLLRFADKTYFRHLAALGVDVVPTIFLREAELGGLTEALARRGWEQAVLKPSFTANAQGAFLFSADEARRVGEEARAAHIDSEWMLQPFVDGVQREGEWSLLFFGGRYSHAVRKRPKAGDFRVQSGHGGTWQHDEPPQSIVDAARRALELAAPHALYARVDGVTIASRFCVMELELVEPELFFRADPPSADRFAVALLEALDARRAG